MATRIYVVTEDGKRTLVEAVSPKQAIMALAKNIYTVEIAKASTVAEIMKNGGEVIQAEAE